MKRFDSLIKTENLKKDEILFDIETTGINKNKDKVFLIGYIDGRTNIFTQLFSEDKNDQEIIETFKSECDNMNFVTYNGRAFDYPFINNRLEYFNLSPLNIKTEYDLYYDINTSRKYFGYTKLKLIDLEKEYSINRSEDIESKEIPGEYMNFLDGSLDYKKLLLHNKEDVLNTEKLLFLREDIKDKKTIELNFNNLKIKGFINDIQIYKDFIYLNIRANSPFDLPIEYSDYNHLINWNKSELKLRIRIVNGIFNKEKAVVYLSTLEKLNDSSRLKLKNNLILFYYQNKYEIENIKKVINSTIKYFTI